MHATRTLAMRFGDYLPIPGINFFFLQYGLRLYENILGTKTYHVMRTHLLKYIKL